MAKRPQRQREEPELDFELRSIGYLDGGLADLRGQAPAAFPVLLEVLGRRDSVTLDNAAPLDAVFVALQEAVDQVAVLNQAAGRVVKTLYALDPSAAVLSPAARYELASAGMGQQFERGIGPGSRRHAFGLLASRLEQPPRATPTSSPRATFVTLDDPSVPNARDVLAHATELRVRTRSGAALLNGYKVLLREMLAGGGELRLLTLLPGSAAADRAYGSAPVLFDANRAVAEVCVQQLIEDVPGARIRWRETAEPASMSQVIALRPGAPAIALVQINLVYAAQGRERPAVLLEEDDRWFAAFADEYEHIWRHRSEERDF